MIAAFNVPHPEVELMLVNGTPVDFGYRVQDGDSIDVYPIDDSIPQSRRKTPPLRPDMPQPPGFILDSNLGRLARYSRLPGFGCLYRNDYCDYEIAQLADRQHRMVLTRDRAYCDTIITHGYFVRSDQPISQIQEVLH